MENSFVNVTLRPWKIEDAEFICSIRNNKELRKWFKQELDISIRQQTDFMLSKEGKEYGGLIIEADKQPVGVCNVKVSKEFGIALLPEFQGKGIAVKAMELLKKKNASLWSDVFVSNPALSWYLWKLGFKAVGVRERSYHKQGLGLVDVVYIDWRKA